MRCVGKCVTTCLPQAVRGYREIFKGGPAMAHRAFFQDMPKGLFKTTAVVFCAAAIVFAAGLLSQTPAGAQTTRKTQTTQTSPAKPVIVQVTGDHSDERVAELFKAGAAPQRDDASDDSANDAPDDSSNEPADESDEPDQPAAVPDIVYPALAIEPMVTVGDDRFRHGGELTHIEVVRGLRRSGETLLPGNGNECILASSNDGTARLWDIQTGELLQSYCHDKAEYLWSARALLAEGAEGSSPRVFTAGSGGIIVWDLKTGKRLSEFATKKRSGMIFRLALDPAGRFVAGGDDNGLVTMWGLLGGNSGKVLGSCRAEKDRVYTLALGKDAKSILMGAETTIRSWDISTSAAVAAGASTVLKVKDPPEQPANAAPKRTPLLKKLLADFGPASEPSTQATQSTTQATQASVASRPVNWNLPENHTGSVFTIVPSPDRTKAVICCAARGPWLMDMTRGGEIWRAKDVPTVHNAAWSADGSTVAAVGEGQLYVLNAADGQKRWGADVGGRPAYAVAFHPDGKSIFCASNHLICRYDAQTGKRIFPAAGELLQNAPAYGVVFLPKAPAGFAQTAPTSQTAASVPASAPAVPRTLWASSQKVPAGAAPNAGLILECGSSPGIRAWDPATGRIVRTWLDKENVHGVAISRDGKKLLASPEQSLKLVDAESGKVIRQWQQQYGNDGVLSPDGRQVVAHESYNRLAVYNADTGGVDCSIGESEGSSFNGWAVGPEMQVALCSDSGIAIWSTGGASGGHAALTHELAGEQARGCMFASDGSLISWSQTALCLWMAQEEQSTRTPLSDDDIQALILQLGSEKYTQREDATQRLTAAGKVILPVIKAAKSDDLETTQRLATIQEAVVKGAKYELTHTVTMKMGDHSRLAIHPNGKQWVVVGSGSSKRQMLFGEIRDRQLKVIGALELPHAPATASFAPDGTLVVGNANGTISMYNNLSAAVPTSSPAASAPATQP